jgi:hypothetical protein
LLHGKQTVFSLEAKLFSIFGSNVVRNKYFIQSRILMLDGKKESPIFEAIWLAKKKQSILGRNWNFRTRNRSSPRLELI